MSTTKLSIGDTKRGLVANITEAATVQAVFDLYEQAGNLTIVAQTAKARGLRSKSRNRRKGSILSHGAIHKLLVNVLYAGKIPHKDKTYDGQHDAIIPLEQWQRIQEQLQGASQKRRGKHVEHTHQSPLIGKLFDETGDHLTPSHSKKKTKAAGSGTPQTVIHRYYISNRLIRSKDPTGWRLPAKRIELAVADLVRTQLPAALLGPSNTISELQQNEAITTKIAALSDTECFQLIHRVDLHPDHVTLSLDADRLGKSTQTFTFANAV
ncbi:MAG: recombinase family protein [Planktomarina sp.]